MNTDYRKPLAGTELDYFDARAAVDALQPGAYDRRKTWCAAAIQLR